MGLIRGLPALALCFLFALTAYSGANIVAFEALAHRAWFGAGGPPLRSVLDSVSAWASTTAVAAAARTLAVDILLVETRGDNAAIEGAVAALAASSPTSTAAWQQLAYTRKAGGSSIESALAALRMSRLTGSHEGYFVMQRVLFGLEFWNELSEADRKSVVQELIVSIGPEVNVPQTRYRGLLEAKPKPERDSLRTMIVAADPGSQNLLTLLGL